MRLSFAGSTGSFGSTYASRLPLPLVSTMIGVQPCDFAESPVSKNVLVFTQPTTPLLEPGPPCDEPQRAVLVVREIEMVREEAGIDVIPLLLSSDPRSRVARPFCSSGITFADGWSEPFLQKSGLFGPRKRALN